VTAIAAVVPASLKHLRLALFSAAGHLRCSLIAANEMLNIK